MQSSNARATHAIKPTLSTGHRTMLHESLNDLNLSGIGGPKAGRLRIDIGAKGEKDLDDLQLTIASGEFEEGEGNARDAHKVD